MMIAFLAAALADQSASGRVTALSPSDARARPPASTATMIVEPIAMAIAAFDSDGDGRTTRAELTAGVAHSFAALDTAHAGKLRYLDYADWALRYLGDRNALPSPFDVDRDGDDAVSLDELQAAFAAAFARYDRDRDGVVTRAELLTIRGGGADDRGLSGRHGKRVR